MFSYAPSPGRLSLFSRYWHYLFIALLTVAYFYPLVLPGIGLPAVGDFFAFHVPFRVFAAQKIHSGEFPLYAHGMLGGYPIFQDPQFAILYPVNLLFALLVADPGPVAIDFFMLVNLASLSLGTVFFARSFGLHRLSSVVASIIGSFNGFMIMHTSHINITQVLATSLVAAGLLIRFSRSGAVDIRLVLGAAIAFAFGNLAGHPQTTLYCHYATALGAAVLAVRRWQLTRDRGESVRILAGTILAFALGILLAAVQLVPTGELLRISTRALVTRGEVIWSGLDISQLPVLMFPGLYMNLPWSLEWPPFKYNPMPNSPDPLYFWLDPYIWEGYIPIGLIATVLGFSGWLLHWRRWPVHVLGWGSLFVLCASTGADVPFYGWLYDYVPGVRLVRVSTRILVLFYPAWGVLAGLGLQGLMQRDPRALTACRWALAVVSVLVLAWVVWIIAGHKGNWMETWRRAFTGDDPTDFVKGMFVLLAKEIEAALLKQVFIAAAVLAVIVAALYIPFRNQRLRPLMLFSVLCIEFVIYCFGQSMAISYEPMTTTDATELSALPEKIPGRAITPHYYHGGNALNAAINMGRPIVNGYSVTIDDWVTAFLPDDLPPWSLGRQELLLDLWNVSHAIFIRYPRTASLGDKRVAIDDWGWTEVGSLWIPESGETSVTARALMPVETAFDFQTTQPVKELHLLAFSGRSGGFPDGTQVAVVSATTTEDDVPVTAPVVLGKHVSDPRYPHVYAATSATVAHSRAPVAHVRSTSTHWSSNVHIFDAKLELTTSAPLKSLRFTATGPYATTLGIAHVVAVLADDSLVIREPVEAGNFKETESRHPGYRVLSRSTTPGYARMVPTATAGSYKQKGFVMWRLFNGETDPRNTVIVDKRKLSDNDLRCINAPHPPAFRGSAAIEWLNDRHGKVTTRANQKGWLFLSKAWDAGWKATVDGEPAEIYRGHGAFMTLPIPAGDHLVELRYRPVGLVAGALISASAMVLTVLIWISAGRRRKLVTIQQ